VSSEQILAAKESVSKCASNYSKPLGTVFVRIAKFVLWFFLTGVLGTIGRLILEVATESGLPGWFLCILCFPAVITVPVLVLARNLVSIAFGSILSAVCGFICVPSAAAIVFSFAGMKRVGIFEVVVISLGMAIAIGWSAFLFSDSDGWTSPGWLRILKRSLFVVNIIIAILFVLSLTVVSK